MIKKWEKMIEIALTELKSLEGITNLLVVLAVVWICGDTMKVVFEKTIGTGDLKWFLASLLYLFVWLIFIFGGLTWSICLIRRGKSK